MNDAIKRCAPTAEQWKLAERELESIFGTVELQCDSYRLALRVACVSVRKFTITFYVDGWMKGEWITKDCEERRRFFRPVIKAVFPPKFIRAMAKCMGKKKAEAEYSKKLTHYEPWWDSFGALKRHLLKNNQLVTITKIGSMELPS